VETFQQYEINKSREPYDETPTSLSFV